MDTYLSFFNLAIELLLEGLPGAPDCQEYLFHCQRGYGTDYFTDVRARVIELPDCCVVPPCVDIRISIVMCRSKLC